MTGKPLLERKSISNYTIKLLRERLLATVNSLRGRASQTTPSNYYARGFSRPSKYYLRGLSRPSNYFLSLVFPGSDCDPPNRSQPTWYVPEDSKVRMAARVTVADLLHIRTTTTQDAMSWLGPSAGG